MRRLVITGLPCPTEAWEEFLGSSPEQRILPIREVFENSGSADPRVLSRYVTAQIEDFRPDSIVCHDLGVPLTLLSLLRLRKRRVPLKTRITLFNGAFRRFDIFKANHPFRLQFMSMKRAIEEVQSHGGKVDLALEAHLPKIRAMYRYIILFGLSEKITALVGMEDLIAPAGKFAGTPMQLIASPNDPYIPRESLHQLEKDFPMKRVVEIEYGHFPYTLPRSRILPLIEEFETASSPEKPRGPRRKARSTARPPSQPAAHRA